MFQPASKVAVELLNSVVNLRGTEGNLSDPTEDRNKQKDKDKHTPPGPPKPPPGPPPKPPKPPKDRDVG